MAVIDNGNKQVRHTMTARGGGNHTATVGGALTDKYYPYINLNVWGEDDLGIELAPAEFSGWTDIPPDQNGKVVLSIPGIMDVEMYTLDTGRVEFAGILYQKPPGPKNKWTFNLYGWENFTFNKVPDPSGYPGATLIQYNGEECWTWDDDGTAGLPAGNHIRPVRMCGGYEVKHATKRNNIVGQTNYYGGMCFEFERPVFIDNNGDTAIADIDITNGVLTVTMNVSNWLNKAVYPVTIDPTFGYTTVGASNFGSNTSDSYANVNATYTYQATTGDQLDTIHIYCAATTGTQAGNVGCYVFDSGVTNLPTTQLVTGSVTATTTPGWQVTSSLSQAMSNGVYYTLAFDTNATNNFRIYYDVGSSDASKDTGTLLPATWSHSAYNNALGSSYGTYSNSGGVTLQNRRAFRGICRGICRGI